MTKLEFLTIDLGETSNQLLQNLLLPHAAEHRYEVQLNWFGWETVWKELVNVGIYQRGADLAEIGSSWLESLAAMNALQPFSAQDLAALGGAGNFIPVTWKNGTLVKDGRIWGIPYRADARVIVYWPALLEKAGVDPLTAFQTPALLETALARLQQVMPAPWAGATVRENNNLYFIASWVWANGGDFISTDGKQVLFDQPAALEGIKAYYRLWRYSPRSRMIGDDAIGRFARREAAVIVTGPWIKQALIEAGLLPDEIACLGLATPFGTPYVGGSLLVLWKHSRYPREAQDLIRFLATDIHPQVEYCGVTGLLPVSAAVWRIPPFSTDPQYQIFYQALSQGRTLPNIPLWGMVEEKLIAVFGHIWAEILACPDADVDNVVEKYIKPLADRLRITLQT